MGRTVLNPAAPAQDWGSARENCIGNRDKNALHDLPNCHKTIYYFQLDEAAAVLDG
jgi:hypothetical protein